MERVLDTAALLHWPVDELNGGVCAPSQRQELERLSSARAMLVSSIDIQWQEVAPAWLNQARQAASLTGDLPRLSDVDLDVLALALGLGLALVTDDYRLQNTVRHAGGSILSVVNTPSKAVWIWELQCTGCRDVAPVPEGVHRSKNADAGSCDRCGSPMKVKRRRA